MIQKPKILSANYDYNLGNFTNNSTSVGFSSKINSWFNLRQSSWGVIVFLFICILSEDSMIFRSYFCILYIYIMPSPKI